ncbi:MAG: arginine--tRNA ligase [Tissierellia bacterium]|nr:arginine--tRNA ligase [Tissierellia bacterium]
MKNFRKYIIDEISSQLNIDSSICQELVEVPPSPQMGDFAFPVFRFAKEYRKAPNLIAEEMKEKFEVKGIIEKVENTGPYLNFFIKDEAFAQEVFQEIGEEKPFSTDIGQGKSRVVEFSSTNIAKPFHIGHLRSTVIGNSLNKIMKYQGFDTIAINYIGDYGTQFGMMIEAYGLWGDEEKINKNPIGELLKLYVRYNEEAAEDEELMEKARAAFDRLEKKDPEALRLWSWFREISLEEFNRVYQMLGVEFDSFDGEAYHSQFIPDVIQELEEKNLLEESDGAMIVNLEEFDLVPAIIKKSNGSSTYITRDVATAIHRKKEYDFDENLYIVASEQILHFKQLRAILKLMGYDFYKDCIHIPFGLISLKEGAMKTRQGKVVFLEEVLKNAIEKTRQIIEERNPQLEDKETIAHRVGVGAIIFQDLYNNRIKDYVFDWDEVLNFEGETGPYVQYAYARSHSILEKQGFDSKSFVDKSRLVAEEEKQLLRRLYQFQEVIERSCEKYEPSYITRYSVDLAQDFNRFYGNCSIQNAEEDLKNSRLFLTYTVNRTLEIALHLIGLETVKEM